MKISVIIPSYNQQQYLNDAIESCLNQIVLPLEIIVVDDGSTDNSLDMAKSYGDRIKVISQVNKGLSSARNTGIMNAKGDYIQFLDADDILMENALERIEKEIKDTKADIIAPSFKCFGLNNDLIILDKNLTAKDFKNNNRIGYFSCVRKDVLLEIGGFSPKMVWGYEDLHLWQDLLKRGKSLSVIQEPLVLYRVKENSMIQIAQAHNDELMAQIMKDHKEIYANTHDDTNNG